MNIKELKNALEKFSYETVLVNSPTGPHSYRGYYEQLAFERSGKDGTVGEFITMLEDCVGRTFTGYKGGEFLMNWDTIVNIADWGCTGGEVVSVSTDEVGIVLNAPYTMWG